MSPLADEISGEAQQVVTEDQSIVENIAIQYPLFGVVTLVRVFEQNARLQLRPRILANPCEF